MANPSTLNLDQNSNQTTFKLPSKQFIIASTEAADLYKTMLSASTLYNAVRDAKLRSRQFNPDELNKILDSLRSAQHEFDKKVRKASSDLKKAHKYKKPKTDRTTKGK